MPQWVIKCYDGAHGIQEGQEARLAFGGERLAGKVLDPKHRLGEMSTMQSILNAFFSNESVSFKDQVSAT